jgi:hypothetical protein
VPPVFYQCYAGYEPGLLPLAIQHLFSLIAEQQQQAGEPGTTGSRRIYTVKLSMMVREKWFGNATLCMLLASFGPSNALPK